MPIFDQGYQHWNGTLRPRGARWMAISLSGIRTQFKPRGTRVLVGFSLVPAFILVFILAIWGLIEQKSPLLDFLLPLARELRLSEEGAASPERYREVVWTICFNYFLAVQTYFCVFLIAAVGPGLISQDLRYNAIPLYLSRPLTRFDYFAGKLGVIAFFLAAVSLAPLLLAYALGVMFSFDVRVVWQMLPLLARSAAYCAVVIVSGGMLMLAISSLSRNSQHIGGYWIGFWMFTGLLAQALTESMHHENYQLISYHQNLNRAREAFLDVDGARAEAAKVVPGRFGGTGGSNPGTGGPFGPTAPPPTFEPPVGPDGYPLPPGSGGPPAFAPPPGPPPPFLAPSTGPDWRMSLLVLAGLTALSAWILSTRVRGLDRLK